MTLQQLQYIIALDQHRHFVKAAESCFVAQPTLTLQVKKLEEEVGIKIFDRSTKPLKPTPQGELFINKTRQILREVNNLKELINTDKQQLEGIFKVGIIPTLAPYLLPLFLKDFSNQHPKITLQIQEMQSDAILEAIENGKLDIGILVPPHYLPNVREIKLFQEPFLFYAEKNHPLLKKEKISEKDIEINDLWLLDQGHCFRDQILNFCSTKNSKTKNRISFTTGSIETLKKMIQSNYGYTFIPELAFTPFEKEYIRPFEDPQPARQVSLLVHQSFTKELVLKNLRDNIQQSIPKSFKKTHNFIAVKWR